MSKSTSRYKEEGDKVERERVWRVNKSNKANISIKSKRLDRSHEIEGNTN